MTTESTQTIRFNVPLPPVWIRSNSRSHWARRVRAKQEYSQTVLMYAVDAEPAWPAAVLNQRWARARVTFTWRACKLPDQANVLPNCKALLDILCTAPKTTQRNDTTYLGIIEDDKGVEAIGRVEKVARRADEGVLVTIERVEDGSA